MRVGACLLVLAAALAFGSRAGAGELEAPLRGGPVEAPIDSPWRLGQNARVLWGMGEWPLPSIEAERRSFGLRLQFELGSDRRERRSPRIR